MHIGCRGPLQRAMAGCVVLLLIQALGDRTEALRARGRCPSTETGHPAEDANSSPPSGRSFRRSVYTVSKAPATLARGAVQEDRTHNALHIRTGFGAHAREENGDNPAMIGKRNATSFQTQSIIAPIHGNRNWLCDPESPSPIVGPSIPIGHNLPAAGAQGYEVSDVVWHPRLNKLFTVHDGNASLPGSVTMLDLDGGTVQNWIIGQDLEGVAIADPNTNFVYLAVEQPNDSVLEFDFVGGVVTRIWDLTSRSACTSGCEVDGVPFPAPPSNDGIEAITFVPDSGPSGGLFYLGLQCDGRIYKVRLDLTSNAGKYAYLGHAARLGPWPGEGGVAIQGLHYDRGNDVLWALIGSTRTRAMRPSGEYLAEWLVPEPEGPQEGIALATDSCEFVVAWDDYEGGPTNRLRKYTFSWCIPECVEQACDECTPTEAPTAAPDGVPKNRYLSVAMGSTGCPAALRVTFGSLPPPFNAFNGSAMWVGPPSALNAVGRAAHEAGTQILMGANLQSTPHFTDWGAIGVVHVFDDEVVPGGQYDVQSIHCACNTDSVTNYSAPLTLLTSQWGDVVGDCSGGTCTPPDGDADFKDITAVVDKFSNLPGAVEKMRADLAGDMPDAIIDFFDVTSAADAFRGIPFPFSGPHGRK